MTPVEIAVLIGAVAIVALTVVYHVVRRIRGKGPSCGSSCGCCPYAGTCHRKERENPPEQGESSEEKDSSGNCR